MTIKQNEKILDEAWCVEQVPATNVTSHRTCGQLRACRDLYRSSERVKLSSSWNILLPSDQHLGASPAPGSAIGMMSWGGGVISITTPTHAIGVESWLGCPRYWGRFRYRTRLVKYGANKQELFDTEFKNAMPDDGNDTCTLSHIVRVI